MFEPELSIELPPGGVMGDSGFYARAADAIRSTFALVGEAADAAQRAGFFASMANWNDEADAAAVEADLTAVWAAVSARRAKQETVVFAEAARQTVAEIASAYAATGESGGGSRAGAAIVGSCNLPVGGTDKGADTSFSSAFDAFVDAVSSLAEERQNSVAADTVHASDDGYIALAESLSVLTEARGHYREVADALITLLEALEAYRQEIGADSQAALAADIQAHLAAEALMDRVSDVRAALAELRVVRSAYNATVTNDVWDLLAEVRIAFAKAAITLGEVQAAVDDRRENRDPYAASAMIAALGDPSEISPDAYDTAMDVVVEVTNDLLRCKAAYEAVEGVLAEVRAVAADALIEARAAVGAKALIEARAAYDMAGSALEALVEAREAFEVGMVLAVPDFVKVGE